MCVGGGIVDHIEDTFDLVVLKVLLGSFSALVEHISYK